MSLRYEQHAAIKRSRQLLVDLLDPKTRPPTQAELNRRIHSCLRHFPMLEKSGKPIWSRDPYTDPKTGEEIPHEKGK